MSKKYVQTNTFYLAGSGVIVGATSIVLTSFTDIYGNVLTMTDFGDTGYITLEPDTTNEEAATFTGVTANANNTYTLTGVKTNLAKSPYTETSGLVRPHSGGTKVVVTDNVAFWNTFGNTANTNTWAATQTFSVPAVQATDPTLSTQVANKSYVDGVAIAGAPKATDSVYGITTLSVAAASPTVPIAVGDNDPRVPTQTENDALVGTSGTPSTTNKYVTNDDTASAATASKVARRNATGDVTVPTTPTATTDAASKAYVDSVIIIPEQDIAYIASNAAVNASTFIFQTNVTGTIGVGIYLASAQVLNVYRFEKTSTGQFVITHTTTETPGTNINRPKVAITSANIFIMSTESATNIMRRYSLADLTGVTSMTLAGTSWGTAATNSNTAFSDGTIVYVGSETTDEFVPYTISGTTATGGTAISFTSAGSPIAACTNGTSVYLSSNTGSSIAIAKYAIAGGAVSSTTTYYPTKDAYPNVGRYNLSMARSTSLYISWGHTIESNTAIVGSAMKTVLVPTF